MPSFSSKAGGLKRNASVELHVSAADRRAGDLCGLALADSVIAWLSKAGMVQDVRRICANLQLDTPVRPNIEALAQREVHFTQSRTIHYVSAEVAIGEWSRNRQGTEVIPLLQARFRAAWQMIITH